MVPSLARPCGRELYSTRSDAAVYEKDACLPSDRPAWRLACLYACLYGIWYRIHALLGTTAGVAHLFHASRPDVDCRMTRRSLTASAVCAVPDTNAATSPVARHRGTR